MENIEQVKRDIETLTSQCVEGLRTTDLVKNGILMASDTLNGKPTVMIFADGDAAHMLYETVLIVQKVVAAKTAARRHESN